MYRVLCLCVSLAVLTPFRLELSPGPYSMRLSDCILSSYDPKSTHPDSTRDMVARYLVGYCGSTTGRLQYL